MSRRSEELPAAQEPGEIVRCADGLRDLGGTGAPDRRAPRAEPRRHRRADVPTSSAATWSASRVFPVPPGPVTREQPRAVREQRDELVELVLPPDERARGDGQIGRIERAERRELTVAELVQALAPSQILQPVLAEVADGDRLEETAGRLGEDDLPAVGGGGDPRRAVDVDADIALVGHDRLARVDPHADADRAVLEGVPRFGGGLDSFGGARETRRRRHPPACRPRRPSAARTRPQDPPVLGEEVGIGRPVLLEEPRRALDVGEEEGDGATRELAHGSILELAPSGIATAGIRLSSEVTPTERSNMATTARKPNRLSDEDLARVLELAKQSDSVELKLTVPASDQRKAVAALELDPLEAQIRQVFFFDTPKLALNAAGVVVRARRIQGKGADSVVKLRPVVPDELPESLRKSPNLVVEVDAMPGGYVCSATLKGKTDALAVRRAAAGDHPIRKLFSKEQRAFFADNAVAGAELDELSVLGPIFVLKLNFRPAELDRRMVAELWLYPDGSRILELSTKCTAADAFQVAAESRAFLTGKGIDLSGEQQTKTKTALEFYSQELEAND